MSKTAWFATSDEMAERWDGPYSREDATAMAADFDNGGYIAEGRQVDPVDWLPSGQDFLDTMEQTAYDNAEGNPDRETFDVSNEALKELERLLEEWARQNVTSSWYVIEGEHIRVEPAELPR